MFASDLDPASRAQLARGARLVELLKQPQSNAATRSRSRSSRSGPAPPASSTTSPSRTSAASRPSCSDYLRRERKILLRRSARRRSSTRTPRSRSRRPSTTFKSQFERRRRGHSRPATRRARARSATRTSTRSRSSSRSADPRTGCVHGRPRRTRCGQPSGIPYRLPTGNRRLRPRHKERRSTWERRCGSTASASSPSTPSRRSRNAMELIAASRVVKARQRVAAADAVHPRADPRRARPWRRTPTRTTR